MNPTRISLLLILLLFCVKGLCSSIFNVDSSCITAYEEFISLKKEKGVEILNFAKKRNPQNLAYLFFENYDDFFALIISEDKSRFDELSVNQKLRIEQLSNLKLESPWVLFAKAEIYLQWAILKFRFKHRISAAVDFRKAYLLLKENEKKYPDFLPNIKSLGIMHVLLSMIPEEYQWFTGLFGLEGSRNLGMAEIALLINSNHFYRTESAMLYATALGFIGNNPEKGVLMLKKIVDFKPNNLLAHYTLGLLQMKIPNAGEAIQTFRNAPIGDQYREFHYQQFLLADCYLFSQEYENAIDAYQNFAQHFRGSRNLKTAHYKIGVCHYLIGNNQKALHYLNIIESMANVDDRLGAHAKMAIKNKIYRPKALLISRYVFDGGFFQKAHDIVQTEMIIPIFKEKYSKNEQLEFYYRAGRSAHRLKLYDKATTYYNYCLNHAADGKKDYFSAFSCLQMGLMCLERDKTKEAMTYFMRIQEFSGYEYEIYIKHQAKLELAKLEK